MNFKVPFSIILTSVQLQCPPKKKGGQEWRAHQVGSPMLAVMIWLSTGRPLALNYGHTMESWELYNLQVPVFPSQRLTWSTQLWPGPWCFQSSHVTVRCISRTENLPRSAPLTGVHTRSVWKACNPRLLDGTPRASDRVNPICDLLPSLPSYWFYFFLSHIQMTDLVQTKHFLN